MCRTLFPRSKRRESCLFGKGERTGLHINILGDSKSDRMDDGDEVLLHLNILGDSKGDRMDDDNEVLTVPNHPPVDA